MDKKLDAMQERLKKLEGLLLASVPTKHKVCLSASVLPGREICSGYVTDALSSEAIWLKYSKLLLIWYSTPLTTIHPAE